MALRRHLSNAVINSEGCNFRTLAELVSRCDGKELQIHLLTSPNNALYMSPDYLH